MLLSYLYVVVIAYFKHMSIGSDWLLSIYMIIILGFNLLSSGFIMVIYLHFYLSTISFWWVAYICWMRVGFRMYSPRGGGCTYQPPCTLPQYTTLQHTPIYILYMIYDMTQHSYMIHSLTYDINYMQMRYN